MAEAESSFEVHGRVTGPEGRELSHADVIVWWQRIRRRDQLVTGRADEDGYFRLRFRVAEDAPRPVLIVVEARSEHLAQPIFSAMTEAQPDLLLNLQAQQLDSSEWAGMLRSIERWLDSLKLTDLVENADHKDITFLARELSKSTEDIMRVVLAARLEAAFGIDGAVFYAFLRLHVPSALPSPLLDAAEDFTLIDGLVHNVASMILKLTADVEEQTLTTAVDRMIIGPQYAAQIPEIVSSLQSQRATNLLTQPYLVGKTTLGDLLSVVKLPPQKQQAFAEALASNSQSLRSFWRTLGDGTHGLTASEASQIERTLSVGAFLRNHVPLVNLLVQGFNTKKYSSLADLARLSQQDWIDLVNQAGGPPPGIEGAGTQSPAEVFARVVYARVTAAYPTAALSSRIASSNFIPQNVRQPLNRFFANNPSLELFKHNIAIYVEKQGDKAFAGISPEDRGAVLEHARRLQRVLRVVESVDAAATLLGLGIHSAAQISQMGRQQFVVIATAAGIAKREAHRIYEAGAQRYAGAVSLYTQLNRDAIGVWPSVIGRLGDLNEPIQQAITRDQSLATLFGSQDYCEVDFCTSILSPAAYLCDLLLWLRNHPQGAQTALDILDARRPDIRHLLLDCPNTETALPYIDVVNELLADAISPPVDPNSTTNPIWKQTTADKTAVDLRAAPQYFNQAAYVTLFGASYPHTLPYSAGLDELRSYLLQAKVPLWQVRQSLLPLHAPSVALRAAVASERLDMSPHEQDLVSTANFVTAQVAWNTGNPPVELAPVQGFMRAASITYESLNELLDVAWVQGGLNIAIQGIDDTCDLNVQSLAPSPLDAGFLDRVHRFLRVWRRTGYQMWEVGALLAAPSVGNGTLDANALIAIQSFWQLQVRTGLGLDQQLAFYQPIDTAIHRDSSGKRTTSLYARIFLNPAVVSVAPDPDLIALPAGGAIADPVLSHHLAAIQAALGVSGTDAVVLFSLTNDQLTLPNLTLLFRVTALAMTAKFSVSDLIAVARLLNPGAANATAALAALFASPAATLEFLANAKTIQQSGFSIDALTYLLTPPLWTTTTQMTAADITATLSAVRQAILNPSGGDVNGSVIAAVAANAHRPGDQGVGNDVTALILQNLQVPGTGQTLLAVLTDPALVAQPGGVFTPITPANFPHQFLAVQLFDKAAVVIRHLKLVTTDLAWLLANAALYGGLDFTQLPVINAQAAIPLGSLLTLLLLVKLARLFSAAPPMSTVQSLYDMISGVSSGALVNVGAAEAALATITGWPLADIVAFTGALGVVFPADYEAPGTYDALRRLEAISAAAAATGAQVVAWGAVPADEPTAETMAASALGAVKAQHPNSAEWLTFAPTVMDPIRERRSAALQGWLIGQRDGGGNLIYGDANGLFDHFLIDVQMSSCEVTTRVIQAYIAVQIFVERCLMNLEAPAVVVDLSKDDTWNQWAWMKRYRIWEANREVFLYPENWLVESQRPNRSQIYRQLEQDVHQGESKTDYLETVVLNYIDRLDGVSHLLVTGTCQDPVTGAIHVVARNSADPPLFYMRSLVNGAWSGWTQIPLDIKSSQAVPAVYRGRVCVFWLDIKVSNEPKQLLPVAQASNNPPNQDALRYVTLGVHFSIFRNGSWAPAMATKGKLFDVPIPAFGTLPSPIPAGFRDSQSIESLYTVKVQAPAPTPGFGASLFVDVFRLGALETFPFFFHDVIGNVDFSKAVHIGRAVFDGHFDELELRNIPAQDGFFDLFGIDFPITGGLLSHAQATYGADARPLLPLPDAQADANLAGEPGLLPEAGALTTAPADPGGSSAQAIALNFTSASALEQNAGPLLNSAPLPFRVVAPVTDLNFDPASDFFFQDQHRAYHVESQKLYWTGSMWSPGLPSNPDTAPFQVRYFFHRFHHAFSRLFWHQLGGGGFAALYDRNLQLNPDQIDPSGADAFGFQNFYQPVLSRVDWDHDDVTGQDREFLDFSYNGSYAVYNWELFFHVPLYIAQLLSQNKQYEVALKWFHFIFDPTRPGNDPAPQRFWIPKPLYDLTSAQILAERINNLLVAVNHGDTNAINQVKSWRNDPFNPFLLADQRPVAFMKRTVMSYLDNLIAWADNLFATESREALSEATLIYVIASEILGPQPAAVTPSQHADESYDQLEPKLDAFANAMVAIENAIGGGGGGGDGGGGMPAAQTFYFKIPPNAKLLDYWTKVADRLNKLRHCQNIKGQTIHLALFDAPIDPALLIKAQAAGVDIGSVLADLAVSLPTYRFTALYPLAADFVGAVRAYGALLLSALEKSDGDQLSLLTATNQQELLKAGDQIIQWQVEQAQNKIDDLNHSLALAQQKHTFNTTQSFMNAGEIVEATINSVLIANYIVVALAETFGAIEAVIPDFMFGAAGFGGSPTAVAKIGGKNFHASSTSAANAGKAVAEALKLGAMLSSKIGGYYRRSDTWDEAAKEAQIQIDQANVQLIGATLGLEIQQQQQVVHQTQVDELQKQIDFMTNKFSNQDLYDWMAAQLADTYFQSYKLAYRLCKQVEACYRFELGIQDSSFIQFGYWDSLHKGLLAGETLNHDLRRMQASYFDQNKRRFELSRYVSLGSISPAALQQLLVTGACDFDLPESLFDNDYPGHFNRHLVRVSVTVVYPNPGKFDNVKATLTLTANKVRVSTDVAGGYAENPVGADPRFLYAYAAAPQKIALGNAQDDPGLFLTSIGNNLSDPRYLPFENAGAASSWHFELPESNNEIDVSAVGDVILHFFYTAVEGGNNFKAAVEADNQANPPTTGIKAISMQNDFSAAWQSFLTTPAGGADQTLSLSLSPSRFPAWTRGKVISVTSIGVLAVAWNAGSFVLQPQAPLPNADVAMAPVAGVTEPNVCSGVVVTPANTPLGPWTFKLRKQASADFHSLTKDDLGDVVFLVNFKVT
jgi:hypothetical protein